MADELFTPGGSPKKDNTKTCVFACLASLLAAVVLGVAAVVLLIVGGAFLVNQVMDTVLAKEPVPLPELELTQEDQDAFWTRMEGFRQSLQGAAPGELAELRLSGQELTLLIRHATQSMGLGQIVHATIEGDTIRGQVSLPLRALGFPLDRYLNGSAALAPVMENGQLAVYLRDITVGDQTVDGKAAEQLNSLNLLQDVQMTPETRALLERIEHVEVEAGTLHLRMRPEGKGAAPHTEPALTHGGGAASPSWPAFATLPRHAA